MTVQDLENSGSNPSKSFWSDLFANRPERRTALSLCILLAIVASGLILRLSDLGRYGLFGDEIYSVLVATGKGDPELIAFDSIRPVYFFLLKWWMNFGNSEEWLRMLSVIFGTANIILTYYLGQLAAGRKVGLVAATAMALSPMEVHYCQLVRMYTLGSFLALLGSIALIKAWQSGGKLFVIAWAVIRTLMVWTLPLTAVLLGADVVLTGLRERKNKLMPFVLAGFALVVGLYLCFAWKMPQLTAHSVYDEWRYSLPTPQIVDALMMFVNFTSTALPIQECEGPRDGGLLAEVYSVAVLALIALSFKPAFEKQWLIWCSAWAFVPILMALIASQFTASFVITRYLMFAAPFTFILLAAGWVELWRLGKPRILAVLTAILYAVIILLNLASLYPNPVSEDWRDISAFIETHERPGDIIVIWNYHAEYLLRYYYKGSNKAYDVTVHHLLDEEKTKLADVKLEMPGLEKVTGRTWFVLREAPQNWLVSWAVYQMFMQHLEKNYKVLEHDKLGRTDLFLVTQKK